MTTACETIRDFGDVLSELERILSQFDRELIGEELLPF
jgi:hypothetical protein